MISPALPAMVVRFCLAVALAGFAAVGAARPETLSNAPLVQALQHGGYVLVMRHASSPRTAPDKTLAELDNTNAERQLDDNGRKTARAMGEAVRKLHIPIGEVLSSPTYRAIETVRLADFGKARPVPELGDGGQGMAADTEGTRSAWLRNRVAAPQQAGINTLIVTHMPNILGAFGQAVSDLADGETMVFQRNSDGTAAMIGRVKIEEWPQLAAGH